MEAGTQLGHYVVDVLLLVDQGIYLFLCGDSATPVECVTNGREASFGALVLPCSSLVVPDEKGRIQRDLEVRNHADHVFQFCHTTGKGRTSQISDSFEWLVRHRSPISRTVSLAGRMASKLPSYGNGIDSSYTRTDGRSFQYAPGTIFVGTSPTTARIKNAIFILAVVLKR